MLKVLRGFASRLIPTPVRATLTNYWTLSAKLGQLASMRVGRPVNVRGEPMPWYTYPAVEYLDQLDFSACTVFEFGSGNSTLFWAKRARRVVSVEDNPEWYAATRANAPPGVEYILAPTQGEYLDALNRQSGRFDVIVVDGNHRYECAVAAGEKVADDGLIILDNSDWFTKTSEYLRGLDLIEVDMAGFGPINGYTWTTSFYFRRSVKLKPRGSRQPVSAAGSLPHADCEWK